MKYRFIGWFVDFDSFSTGLKEIASLTCAFCSFDAAEAMSAL
jgi:hypothetical protein